MLCATNDSGQPYFVGQGSGFVINEAFLATFTGGDPCYPKAAIAYACEGRREALNAFSADQALGVDCF